MLHSEKTRESWAQRPSVRDDAIISAVSHAYLPRALLCRENNRKRCCHVMTQFVLIKGEVGLLILSTQMTFLDPLSKICAVMTLTNCLFASSARIFPPQYIPALDGKLSEPAFQFELSSSVNRRMYELFLPNVMLLHTTYPQRVNRKWRQRN